jgi:hypothetical protein
MKMKALIVTSIMLLGGAMAKDNTSVDAKALLEKSEKK